MAWVWKAVGVAVGASLAGPLGAGIGAAIGHGLDSWPAGGLSDEDSAVVGIAGFLARLARETGRLEPRQKELIAAICREQIPGSQLSEQQILPQLESWSQDDQLYQQVLTVGRQHEDVRLALITAAWRVACRDNRVDEYEIAWIHRNAFAMGLNEEQLFHCSVPFVRSAGDDAARGEARSLMGLDAAASEDEIAKRYRQLSLKYHPDSHATADPALRELAAERFAKIAHAYELLRGGGFTYFGASVSGDGIAQAESRALVRCFFCRQKCRLPEPRHFSSARCPKCQTLLLFEEELAVALAAGPQASAPNSGSSAGQAARGPGGPVDVQHIEQLLGGFTNSRLFLAPAIPHNKLTNALSAYGAGLQPQQVLLLYDDTIFGGAREGVMLTADAVYWHNIADEPVRIPYRQVHSVVHEEATSLFQNAGVVVNGKKAVTNTADQENQLAERLAHVIRCLAG